MFIVFEWCGECRLHCVRYLLHSQASTMSLVCYMDVFHRSTIRNVFSLSPRIRSLSTRTTESSSVLCQNDEYTLCADYAKIFVLSFYLFPFKCDHSVFSAQFIRFNWMFRVCCVRCCALVSECSLNLRLLVFSSFFFHISTYLILGLPSSLPLRMPRT